MEAPNTDTPEGRQAFMNAHPLTDYIPRVMAELQAFRAYMQANRPS